MLSEHLKYLSDPARLDAYRRAISRVLRKGDRVLDLGCGSGVLGLFCLEAGASQVIAVDSSPAIQVARESLARAGFLEQATFINELSTQATLPEPVDLVVCDNVGYFGFDYGILEALGDARARFLKPGGALVPSRLRLEVALVESDECLRTVSGWSEPPVPAPFHWIRTLAANTTQPIRLAPGDLLGEPQELGELDLAAEQPAYHAWEVRLRPGRVGRLHGLAGWFHADLAPGVSMTNSPLRSGAIQRSQLFLPVLEGPLVGPGDALHLRLMARPAEHLLAWSVDMVGTGWRATHSTWLGEVLRPGDLIRRNPELPLTPNTRGRARALVLSYCDGQRSARDVEALILRDHPDLFPSRAEILRFVAEVLGRDAST